MRSISPLTVRIFGFPAIAIAVALGAALVLTQRIAARAAATSIEKGLDAAHASIEDKLAARSQKLLALAEGVAGVPSFLALVERALSARDRSSLLDATQSFREPLGAEWVLITDAQGILQAWSDHPERFGNDMSGGALVGYALQGDSREGIWLEPTDGGDRLYQAVAVPFRPGAGSPIGVMVAALPVDSALVEILRRNTTADVVVFSRDTAWAPHPLAGRVPEGADLGRALGADTSVDRVLFRSARGDWVGTIVPLRTAGGDPVGGVLGLRSREAELAPFVRLERLVTVGLVVGLVVALLSAAWIARRITRPVSVLVEATRRIEAGDYGAPVEAISNDEIGELARAFRHMQDALTEKQRLVEFLSRPVTVGDRLAPAATVDPPGTGNGALEPGTVLAGRYELKELLGAGGMGVVYRALDRHLGETVALKTLRPGVATGSDTLLERFKQEIRLARRITHRNVVRTHDFGEVDGTYFITMEFVEGTTLDKLIRRRGRLPVDVTLTVGKQLCRALEVAHEAGVIHRDIKPSNLVVDGAGFLKVMDFGIARLVESARGGNALTQAGSVIGSPDYMALEQLMGQELDHRVDIYAAGCVLFECLTGHPLYPAPNYLTLLAKQLEEPVPDVRADNPEVPPFLAAAITRAVAKDRNDRWPSAAALLEALEQG